MLSSDDCSFLMLFCVTVGIVASLEGQSTDGDVFDALVKPDIGLSNEVILTIASGLYRLIQLALRFSESSLKPEVYTILTIATAFYLLW